MFSFNLKTGLFNTLWQSIAISLGIVALLVLVRFARGPATVEIPELSHSQIVVDTVSEGERYDEPADAQNVDIKLVDGAAHENPEQNPVVSIPDPPLSNQREAADIEPELFPIGKLEQRDRISVGRSAYRS